LSKLFETLFVMHTKVIRNPFFEGKL
jgi:hypothetical protein